jgi:ABC-type multidrug transport system fused ATPase/permease subunit
LPSGVAFYTALALVPALLIGQFLIALGSQTGEAILWQLAILMVWVTALMALMRYLEGAFGHVAAYGVLHDLRMRTYQHLQRLSMGFHTRQQSGTWPLSSSATWQLSSCSPPTPAFKLIEAALIPFVLGLVMFIANLRLALVALSPIPIILVLLIAFRGPVYRAFATYREELGRLIGMIIDHVQGVGVLKAFAALRPAWNQVEERSDHLSRAAIRMNLLHTS